MTTKFSQFTNGVTVRSTDILVGLRDNANTKATLEDGIHDDNGNYLIGWTSVDSATTYISFTNAITGGEPLIGVVGVGADLPITIQSEGAGDIKLTPGTSGQVTIDATTAIQVPVGTQVQRPLVGAAGQLRYDTDTDYLEYWDAGAGAWVIIIAGAAFDTATYITQTDETADLPNSQPLASLSTGIAYVTTTTGVVGTRTLTGTSNQIDIANGTGAGGNPTFTIADNPVLPGTGSVQAPDGTTAQRSGSAGSLRFNTTTGLLEFTNDGAAWAAFASTAGATIPTVAQGDILYADAADSLAALNKDTNATRYLSNTGASNNPAWAQVDLTNGVTGALPVSDLAALTASRAVVTDGSGFISAATTTATEIGYVNGVTSAIQTQIDDKISQSGAQIYAADSVGTDSYAVTLSPAPSSYTTGMVVNFQAGTANTGSASLNVNSLGAITIKKNHDQDLADNDIESGQIVTVVYDGTNFQMQSQLANTSTGGADAASQSEMEAATSVVVYTSPGRQQYHPGHPKVWVRYTTNTTSSIISSYNMTSITDNGTGDTTITIATDFSADTYTATATCSASTTTSSVMAMIFTLLSGSPTYSAPAVGSYRILTANISIGNLDCDAVCSVAFGDQ